MRVFTSIFFFINIFGILTWFALKIFEVQNEKYFYDSEKIRGVRQKSTKKIKKLKFKVETWEPRNTSHNSRGPIIFYRKLNTIIRIVERKICSIFNNCCIINVFLTKERYICDPKTRSCLWLNNDKTIRFSGYREINKSLFRKNR